MRRRSRPLLLALLASLAATANVLGGGWAQVTVTDVPADLTAETETVIGMTVMQHGETAVSWPTLTVVATDADSGAVVRADARPSGPVGAYVARITFPVAGTWTLAFESRDLIMEGGASIPVGPPTTAVAVSSATPSTGVADMAPQGLAALLGIALLAGAWLMIRGRRSPRGDSSVSANG